MRLSEIVQNNTQLEPTVINQVAAIMQILVNAAVMDVDVSIFSFMMQHYKILSHVDNFFVGDKETEISPIEYTSVYTTVDPLLQPPEMRTSLYTFGTLYFNPLK